MDIHLCSGKFVPNFIYLAIPDFEFLSSHELGQTDRHTSRKRMLPKI